MPLQGYITSMNSLINKTTKEKKNTITNKINNQMNKQSNKYNLNERVCVATLSPRHNI